MFVPPPPSPDRSTTPRNLTPFSPRQAPAGKGGMGTGFYAGYEAGKRKGQGLDGVIAGAAAAYYKFHH